MKVEEHFIHNKIAVPAISLRTSRRRLLDLLAENVASANATIVNGRAGTGKTALAADFARHAGRAVAWYKVDAVDNDLRMFCEYLTKAVRLQRPAIEPGRLLELTETVESDRAELLAEALVFQLDETKGEPLLMVIEDLHLVYDADWVVPFFRRFLPLLPPDVHVLITCRSLPPAPLWRLRSKQMLCVVDESELAFTLDEAVALFKTYGLTEEHARIAWVQTGGKAATISDFASTPGRAGRAVADKLLSLKPANFPSLTRTPDFQT
jgi:LuxR family transcriptional regulator, maltose regulon positive regulatory protein